MKSKLSLLFLLFTLNGYTQTFRIDSLKKTLPALTGREAVNCLNSIATEFNFKFIRADSAKQYAKEAYEKATTINYKSGMAVALLIQGEVEGRLLGNPTIMQRNSQQAIKLLESENDPKNLSQAYYKLAVSYFSHGARANAIAAAGKAKEIALAAGDKPGIGWALQAAGIIYCHNGAYWKSFENMIEAERIGREINDSLLISTALAFIGRSFNRVGDPKMALKYYYQSMPFATPFLLLWPHLDDVAYAHQQLEQYDSAAYYQQMHQNNLNLLAIEPAVRKKFAVFDWGYTAELQLARKEYDEVLIKVLPAITQLQTTKDVIPLMELQLIAGKCYKAKGNLTTALQFSRSLQTTANRTLNQQYLGQANKLLSSVFENLKKPDSAFLYFKNYIAIKDTIAASQFAQRTALYQAASAADARIDLLQKDNTIAQQRLDINKKELMKQNQLRNILLAGLLAMFLLFALLARNIFLKRKNEQLQHEQIQLALKRKTLELEMQALRAQMNPHFIFNCLSAIDNLIQTSQPDKATSYLARFANLIRGVLDSSKSNLVPFQKDFETLALYLEMEQFRCNNKFVYKLEADQELLNGDYKVPPLIV